MATKQARVACLEFHSKSNAIGGDIIDMVKFAVAEVEKNFEGLVIGNHGKKAPGLETAEIDDVIFGCAFPEAEQGMNVGRMIALRAGLPYSVPGVTVNRFCSSGLEAIAIAATRIMAGFAVTQVAGGAESMSIVPMGGNKLPPNPYLMENLPAAYMSMCLTAENVAARYNISRENQDTFAMASHQKASSPKT